MIWILLFLYFKCILILLAFFPNNSLTICISHELVIAPQLKLSTHHMSLLFF